MLPTSILECCNRLHENLLVHKYILVTQSGVRKEMILQMWRISRARELKTIDHDHGANFNEGKCLKS